jgi:hypothetical protein
LRLPFPTAEPPPSPLPSGRGAGGEGDGASGDILGEGPGVRDFGWGRHHACPFFVATTFRIRPCGTYIRPCFLRRCMIRPVISISTDMRIRPHSERVGMAVGAGPCCGVYTATRVTLLAGM